LDIVYPPLDLVWLPK